MHLTPQVFNMSTRHVLDVASVRWRNQRMPGRPPSPNPDLATLGGRILWAIALEGHVTQEKLAHAMGYKNQSGLGNAIARGAIPAGKAKQGADYLKAESGYAITATWLLYGGELPGRTADVGRTGTSNPDYPDLEEIARLWGTIFEDEREAILLQVRAAYDASVRVYEEMNKRGLLKGDVPPRAPGASFRAPPQAPLPHLEPAQKGKRGPTP